MKSRKKPFLNNFLLPCKGLHVYHHSMVPLMAWIYFRIKVEHVTARAFGMLNTPIHTVM
mgnify:CR=1 FL=1